MNKKEIANFFWHGEFSVVEDACVKSFVKQGFDVHMWSYTGIQVDGAKSCDASQILPKNDIFKYQHAYEGMISESSKLAAFSDVFRYKVMSFNFGWWFDTDCYCLKNQLEFKKLKKNKSLVAGLENLKTSILANGAMWADNIFLDFINKKTKEISEQKNYILSFWGELGPTLITKTALNLKLQNQFLPIDNFYAIQMVQDDLFIDPSKKKYAKSLIKNSYLTHIWTKQWKNKNIDRNNLPKDSLIENLVQFNYNNESEQENKIVLDSLNYHKKLNDISNLYLNIFKRPADLEGLTHYMSSGLSINEIENIFLQSDEYKKCIVR
jgi:hypothetical protein